MTPTNFTRTSLLKPLLCRRAVGRRPEARLRTLANQMALGLGERGEDVEDEAAPGSPGPDLEA